jgi:SAM-dependent methyltransferase
MMTLMDVISRKTPPAPWQEGDNIPWNDPEFSRRMLGEHLSQSHDLASRRFARIDEHVAWIWETVLQREPTRVLDLTCGPGLYTSRLARCGCQCTGIDYGPASIEYAASEAEREALACTYVLGDVRQTEFGDGFGLVMMLFGQFNVFRREEARELVAKAAAALQPQGALLLEPQRFQTVKANDTKRPSWHSHGESALFSDRPHLVLTESFWNEQSRTATERFHIIDAETGRVARHALSTEAYRDQEYHQILTEAGFRHVEIFPSLIGDEDGDDPWNLGIVARKAKT